MSDYLKMTRAELEAEQAALKKAYESYLKQDLHLDMSRGKPSSAQLDLSMEMLSLTDWQDDTGVDARNYGALEGLPEARRFFGEMLGLSEEEVIVGGNASLALMYYAVDVGWRKGFPGGDGPWMNCPSRKFLCPAPGYDRHFRVTEYFGFELITIPMTETGPDMDMVEKYAADPDVKGIWCVPLYSNPDGYCYSDETVRRLAGMVTGAPDFKIMWDNAYGVHHLTDDHPTLLNIMEACTSAGHPNRPLLFCSTSKITFSGAGVSAMGASRDLIAYFAKQMFPMTISYDKMNQLRHVRYLKDMEQVARHMLRHRALLLPKFKTVLGALEEQLAPCGAIARWTEPKGGYFVSLYTMAGCAKRTVELCRGAGVVLTGAGAAYPYGLDPADSNIRIAPSLPPVEELAVAADLLCLCVRLATLEKLLAA